MRVGFRVSLNYFSLLTRNTFIGCSTVFTVFSTSVCRFSLDMFTLVC